MVKKDLQGEWWSNNGGFFGKSYICGDDSMEGYLPGTQESLEERTKRECDGVMKLIGLKKHMKILDIPCGYGRHSIYLAKRGYGVVGLDINNEHLDFAKREAKMEGVSINFLVRDMRDIGTDLHKNFDVVLNMFFSFGFFNEEDNLNAMKQFYNSLKYDGKLVIHTDVSPEMVLRGNNYRLCERRSLRNGECLAIEEKYDRSTGRINGTWNIVDKQGVICMLSPYSVRIYSANEYKEMLRKCGFRDIEIYGSFDGEKFTCNSKEMIVIGTK